MIAKRMIPAAAALMVAFQANTAEAWQPDVEKAEALKAQAEQLFDQPARWVEAARLLEKSVEYRPATDAEIHASLMTAASIWLNAGDQERAYSAARRAGENAHDRGAVPDAAHAFISAAAVAAGLGHRREADALMDRARMLAESPLLSQQQRSRILARDMSFVASR
jgi:tetratricopeptide (TPR) repeat protein